MSHRSVNKGGNSGLETEFDFIIIGKDISEYSIQPYF